MTYQFGLIGYPIQHSLSPWIHRQLLQASGIKGEYNLYEINPDSPFEQEMIRLKDRKLDGYNVTVPYKQKIIPYLDEIDSSALACGAVNTVIHYKGKQIGYNTDGVGYIEAFRNVYPGFLTQQRRCLIIGSGGAARAIYVSLSEHGLTQIDIANRTKKHAEEIAALGEQYTNTNVLGLKEAEIFLGNYDILIQTTSVGMKPDMNEMVMSLENINEESIISDIIYQPMHTKFLQQAERKGVSILYGHWMLLYQAKCAYEKWTDSSVDVKHLTKQLQLKLEGR